MSSLVDAVLALSVLIGLSAVVANLLADSPTLQASLEAGLNPDEEGDA